MITVVVVLVAVVSIASGVALFARQDAHRGAENTARQVGSVLGVALVGMVLASGSIESTAGWALALPCVAMLIGAV